MDQYRTTALALLLLVLLVTPTGVGCTEEVSQAGMAAIASTTAERFAGEGTMFSPEGEAVTDYTVELTRREAEEGFVQDVVVLLPDGRTMAFQQHIGRTEGGRFTIDSDADAGQGGGLDLGEGMITTYTAGADGEAQASTIAMDGQDGQGGMRIVRYELVDGQATRIYREVYHRIE